MSSLSILELDHSSARDFFLKHESYCNIDLPGYFSFTNLLKNISTEMLGKKLSDFAHGSSIKTYNDVNYLIYANKDGKLSWRPLQIIHPLVYVNLVHEITSEQNWKILQNRFRKFQSKQNIKCLSIPIQSNNSQKDKAQQILKWWENVEQESIYLSLEYNYIFDTDIADCYGSIYTHSIDWAITSKAKAKQRPKKGLGKFIDTSIQNAQYGQTNGIPQGSVLMDFIAEIVLGYIDKILDLRLKRMKIFDYKILRYRDDYRIFVKNLSDGENIVRTLSEKIMPFGLKLNTSKTKSNLDIISQSIKRDKLDWLRNEKDIDSLQKRILILRQHSIEHPNSGSLNSALNEYDKSLEKKEKVINYPSLEAYIIALNTSNQYVERKLANAEQIISIVTDIAYSNPKVIPVCCSIISKLFSKSDESEKVKRLVYEKLIKMPNSGFVQIWMQRMLKSELENFAFSEKMCNLYKSNFSLWNSDWVSSPNILNLLNTPIFQQNEFSELNDTISNNEVNIFDY